MGCDIVSEDFILKQLEDNKCNNSINMEIGSYGLFDFLLYKTRKKINEYNEEYSSYIFSIGVRVGEEQYFNSIQSIVMTTDRRDDGLLETVCMNNNDITTNIMKEIVEFRRYPKEEHDEILKQFI